jgi:transposase-like protein
MQQPARKWAQEHRARARLRMIQHYEQVTHNVSQTCRFFGISRTQVYMGLRRYREAGVEGLKDRPRGPRIRPYRIPAASGSVNSGSRSPSL